MLYIFISFVFFLISNPSYFFYLFCVISYSGVLLSCEHLNDDQGLPPGPWTHPLYPPWADNQWQAIKYPSKQSIFFLLKPNPPWVKHGNGKRFSNRCSLVGVLIWTSSTICPVTLLLEGICLATAKMYKITIVHCTLRKYQRNLALNQELFFKADNHLDR